MRKTGMVALLAIFAHAAFGQQAEVERDPFSAPNISKVVEAADRDRVARITSEIVEARMAELEQSIITEVERRLSAQLDRRLSDFDLQVSDKVETRLSEMAGIVTALRDEVPALISEELKKRTGASGEVAPGGIPEGSAFVACVDGRALYRDENGSTFYADLTMEDTGVSRCSN